MTQIKHKLKGTAANVPTLRRLPAYLNLITRYRDEGVEHISGTIIAGELELEPIQVRKDLAITGITGKPRVGYEINDLIKAITDFLNWNRPTPTIVIGAGHLGNALSRYELLKIHGMALECFFDSDKEKHDTTIAGKPVYPNEKLDEIVKSKEIELAILTVPASAAREAAEKLVNAGIKLIWNFTNVKLKLPEEVSVLQEDLSSGFAVISFLKDCI